MQHDLHLLFAYAEQFTIGLCDDFDEVDVLTPQFFVAPLLKKLCNLHKKVMTSSEFSFSSFLGRWIIKNHNTENRFIKKVSPLVGVADSEQHIHRA